MDRVSLLPPEDRAIVTTTHKKLVCKGKVAWHNVAYTEWKHNKKPSGKTVVMIHGLTSNQEAFNVLAEFLVVKLGHTCVTADMVGRGKSSWMADSSEYNYERYAQDVACLIASVNNSELYYIGTSMGGLIAFHLASLPGVPIKKLVINDIGSFVPKAALERISKYVGKNMVWEDAAKLKEYMALIYKPFGLSEELLEFISKIYTVQEENHVRFHYDPRIADAFQVTEWTDFDLTPLWDRIDKLLPVLLIHGENSDILSSETIARMQAGREETTEVYHVPNVGHAPMLFSLDEAERIAAFLH